MEIKNTLNGLTAYDSSRLERGEADKAKARRQDAGQSLEGKGDRVEFSDEGKLRTEAFKAAQSAPDVRQDKVAAIKARIAAGEYQMDSGTIAANLIRDELDLP